VLFGVKLFSNIILYKMVEFLLEKELKYERKYCIMCRKRLLNPIKCRKCPKDNQNVWWCEEHYKQHLEYHIEEDKKSIDIGLGFGKVRQDIWEKPKKIGGIF